MHPIQSPFDSTLDYTSTQRSAHYNQLTRGSESHHATSNYSAQISSAQILSSRLTPQSRHIPSPLACSSIHLTLRSLRSARQFTATRCVRQATPGRKSSQWCRLLQPLPVTADAASCLLRSLAARRRAVCPTSYCCCFWYQWRWRCCDRCSPRLARSTYSEASAATLGCWCCDYHCRSLHSRPLHFCRHCQSLSVRSRPWVRPVPRPSPSVPGRRAAVSVLRVVSVRLHVLASSVQQRTGVAARLAVPQSLSLGLPSRRHVGLHEPLARGGPSSGQRRQWQWSRCSAV